MAKVRFFTQKMIDEWVAQGKAEFNGQILRILVGNPGTYELKNATMFLDVLEGADHRKLKRKVLTEDHLQALGADVYLDSAIIGDTAYKVEPGFIVAIEAGSSESSAESPPVAAEPVQPAAGGDSLADLMLKSLRGNS